MPPEGFNAIDDGSRVLVRNIAPGATPLLADHLRRLGLAEFQDTPESLAITADCGSGHLRQFTFEKVRGITAGAVQTALDIFNNA